MDIQSLLQETREIGSLVENIKTSHSFIYNNITGLYIDPGLEQHNPPTELEIKKHIEQTQVKLRIKQLEHELKLLRESLSLMDNRF